MDVKHVRTIPFDIKWILARTHISRTYIEVAADIAGRLDNQGFFGSIRARAITDALIQHRRNRLDYAWVMGPH